MGNLVPFTVHIRDNVFLNEPERIFIECGNPIDFFMSPYRYQNPVGCDYVTENVELDNGMVLPLVVGTGLINVEAFTINYGGHNFANKYFTVELFGQYFNGWCCGQCIDCDDTCFLILNNCLAKVNGQGLLI